MAILKIKDPRSVTVKILPRKTRVQIRFEIGGASQYESIEFEIASIMALALATEAQKLLSPGSTPVLPSRARAAGKRN